MRVYRNALMAGAAMLAIGLSQPASADPVTFWPAAPNGGVRTVNLAGPFQATGGLGVAYQDMNIATTTPGVDPSVGTGTNQAYSTDIVVSITSFVNGSTPVNGTEIGTNWSLIAVISLSGIGSWSPTDTFVASTATMNMQIYGVSSAITGEQNPGTHTLAVPGGTTLSSNDFGSLGAFGVGGVANTGCYDGSNSPIASNCILLASSTSSAGDALSVTGVGNVGDSETFSIAGVLDPQSYATGVGNGFFDIPATFSMVLTVDSGDGSSGLDATPITVSNDQGTPAIGYTTGDCDAHPHATNCGQDVNWAISVPEPASLTLLGTALAFVGAAARRRRKARS